MPAGARPIVKAMLSGGGPARALFIDDTDFDSDIDDLTQLALFLGLIEEDGGTMAAATVASSFADCAPAVKACLDYAGYTTVPVGGYLGSTVPSGSIFADDMRAAFRPGDSKANYPGAVTVLRTVLTAAPALSVRIAIVGTCTNIADLINSAADAISPLTGAQLLAAKVHSIWVMGGSINNPDTQEHNITYDVAAANVVAAQTTTPVYWVPYEVGGDITIGTKIPTTADRLVDPFKLGWDAGSPGFLDGNGNRYSWDTCTVYAMRRGVANGTMAVNGPGNMFFQSTGNVTNWSLSASGNNYYITKVASNATIQGLMQSSVDAFILRHDTTGPTVTSLTTVGVSQGAAFSQLITASEPFTAAITGTANGFSISGGNTLERASNPTLGSFDVTVRLTDGKGNTRDVLHTLAVTSSSLAAETTALLGRMTSTPDATRQGHIDTLIVALKTGATSGSNLWARLDLLFLLAAHDKQAAFLNWKGATGDISEFGTTPPTFTTDRGTTGNVANTAYLSPNFDTIQVGTQFQSTSCHLGCFVLTTSAVTQFDIGVVGGRTGVRGSSAPQARMISTASVSGTGSAPHHIMGIRRDNVNQLMFRNGTQNASAANATSVAGSEFLEIHRWNGANYSDRQVAAVHTGGVLSDAEAVDLYNALRTYLLAVGVTGI